MKHISSSKSVLYISTIWKGVNALFNLVILCLGKTILELLHHLYSLVISVKRLSVDTVNFITSINQHQDVKLIENRIPSFRKIPSHLVLILGLESPSYEDLFKIIVWCFPAGISHISFYDHKNSINPQTLFETVSTLGKNYIPKIKWGKSFSTETKLQSKRLINGYTWNPLLHVHVYKREDGLENFVEIVKSLHEEDIKRIDQSGLNEMMRKHLEAPDPDLAIICGPTLCYYGFPPWNLRITLMHSIISHHNINVTTFLRLLDKYNQSEQRYGK